MGSCHSTNKSEKIRKSHEPVNLGDKNKKTAESETKRTVCIMEANLDGDGLERITKFNKEEDMKKSTSGFTSRAVSRNLTEKSKSNIWVVQRETEIPVSSKHVVSELSGDPSQKYRIISKLGAGAYASIYLVEERKTGMKRAMKKLSKKEFNLKPDNELINDEMSILKKLDHPNIVRIFDVYTTSKYYYLIIEYCPNGELFSKIKQKFTEMQVAVIMFQILSSMTYIHSFNIIHRDLKLENILIRNINKDGSYYIKIIDFGTALPLYDKKTEDSVMAGTSYYIAPEAIRGSYSDKCDMWSCGIILYMLLVNIAPFNGDTDEEIIEAVKKGIYNKSILESQKLSLDSIDLISKLLTSNPTRRLSATEALNHTWFKKLKIKQYLHYLDEKSIGYYLNRLINFRIVSKFQQVILKYLVRNVLFEEENDDEIQEILRLFRLIDDDFDGKIYKEHLSHGLRFIKKKKEAKNIVDELFMFIDGDHKGFITYEEFLIACMDKDKLIKHDENVLKRAFNYFDRDRSGTITLDDLLNIFQLEKTEENKQVVEYMIKEISSDKDSVITYTQFKDLISSVCCE